MGLGGLLQIRERLVATADLSSSQYKFVNLDGTLSGAGELAFILVDKPGDTEVGTIVLQGKEKVTAGGSITKGDKIASDASGDAVTATTGDEVLGIAMEDAADGDVFMILANPMGVL